MKLYDKHFSFMDVNPGYKLFRFKKRYQIEMRHDTERCINLFCTQRVEEFLNIKISKLFLYLYSLINIHSTKHFLLRY